MGRYHSCDWLGARSHGVYFHNHCKEQRAVSLCRQTRRTHDAQNVTFCATIRTKSEASHARLDIPRPAMRGRCAKARCSTALHLGLIIQIKRLSGDQNRPPSLIWRVPGGFSVAVQTLWHWFVGHKRGHLSLSPNAAMTSCTRRSRVLIPPGVSVLISALLVLVCCDPGKCDCMTPDCHPLVLLSLPCLWLMRYRGINHNVWKLIRFLWGKLSHSYLLRIWVKSLSLVLVLYVVL